MALTLVRAKKKLILEERPKNDKAIVQVFSELKKVPRSSSLMSRFVRVHQQIVGSSHVSSLSVILATFLVLLALFLR